MRNIDQEGLVTTSRYSDEQIVKIMREPHAQGEEWTARKFEVSENAIYIWQGKFGDRESNQLSELKRIMQESIRLTKIVSELDPETFPICFWSSSS